MTNVSEWSTSAGSNNSAPPDGWPENMLPGKVNDCAREMMAALAQWYQDQNATLTTAGTTTAYTLATNSGYTALSDIPVLAFRVHAANTGASTLNVDGLGAKSMVKAGSSTLASGDLAISQIVCVAYNATLDRFDTIGPQTAAAAVFATGTPMLFGQTSAPTGWTKSLTHDNKALRLVTGTASSGGTTAFTSVLTSRTIATANLPAHTHDSGTLVTSSSGSHNHDYEEPTSSGNVAGGGNGFWRDSTSSSSTSTDGSHTHTISGSTGSIGSGTAMDFAIQYVDVIMATKD